MLTVVRLTSASTGSANRARQAWQARQARKVRLTSASTGSANVNRSTSLIVRILFDRSMSCVLAGGLRIKGSLTAGFYLDCEAQRGEACRVHVLVRRAIRLIKR